MHFCRNEVYKNKFVINFLFIFEQKERIHSFNNDLYEIYDFRWNFIYIKIISYCDISFKNNMSKDYYEILGLKRDST